MSKLNLTKILGFVAAFVLLIAPFLIVSAAQVGGSSAVIKNPLGTNDVQGLLIKIMNLVVKVGAVIVVFFIIYSGYKFVTARGNPEEIKEAKNTFYATIIGGAILLGADIIANVVVNTVKATTGAR